MGDHNPFKTTIRFKHTDTILVVAGQASIVLGIGLDVLTPWLVLAGIALGATGLGLRARQSGRGVVSWVLLGIFFPVLVPLIGLAVMMIRGIRPPNQSVSGESPVNMYGHGATALALFLVAALFMDSMSLALLSFVIAVIWVSMRREARYTGRVRLVVIGIYALMLVMVFAMKEINYRVSHANAKAIIEACERFKEKTGEYPAQLGSLVPDYLPEVPRARYTVMSGGFYYRRDAGSEAPQKNYRLIFVNEAPFARSVYSSASKGWHSVD